MLYPQYSRLTILYPQYHLDQDDLDGQYYRSIIV